MNRVCVLLCTYNGEQYLREQINSIKSQKGVDVSIIAHDDGSADKTVEILQNYGIRIIGEQHLGPAEGFLYLLKNCPKADYYAFCDQDDIWDRDKLETAAGMLSAKNNSAVYCCSSILTDEAGNAIKKHCIDDKRSLKARLLYAGISGNTVVLNEKMRETILQYQPKRMIMHDSWIVKTCIATGGDLITDTEAHIHYRIHGKNTWGLEMNLLQKIRKFIFVIFDRNAKKEFEAICELYQDQISEVYRGYLQQLFSYRTSWKAKMEFLLKNKPEFHHFFFDLAITVKIILGTL